MLTATARGFRERGFAVVDILSDHEAATHRDAIIALAGARLGGGGPTRWSSVHGVSETPALWPLIFHEELLEAVRTVLDSETIWFAGHSDVKVWQEQPASGWHRDSIDERGLGGEWSEDYRVVRVALYLQPVCEHFMWGVLPGSQHGERSLRRWERALWQRVQPSPPVAIGSRLPHIAVHHGRPWIRVGTSGPPWRPPVEPLWLTTHPTRCVIFDPRVIHAGGPVAGTKVAAFLAFGAANDHTRRHMLHFGAPPHESQSPLHERLRRHGLATA